MSYFITALIGAFFACFATLYISHLKNEDSEQIKSLLINSSIISISNIFLVLLLRLTIRINFYYANIITIFSYFLGTSSAIFFYKNTIKISINKKD